MKKDRELLKIVRKLIEASFSDGKIVEKEIIKSIKILRSLPQSKSILAMSEYLKWLKRKEREHTLYIETTIPLSSVQINKMKKIIEKKSAGGERSRTITKVLISMKPGILGGFKLRVGDEVWDDSILGKIQQVKEAING